MTPRVVRVERLELFFRPKQWPFANERRTDIDAHFVRLQKAKPELWNGRVLLAHEQSLSGGVFRASFLETDFASFRAYRDWRVDNAGVWDVFAAAAIRASDGAFLLGEMGKHTANAGLVYFPCGTPDGSDIKGGLVDFEGSVARELKEETGLSVSEFSADPGWFALFDEPMIPLIKLLQSREDAETLRTRVLGNLAQEKQPELSGIRIVRSPSDFNAMMPRFVTTFLAAQFARR
jgi:8-oxo-dGTP pyrophosphatase MutT (NUDIX family)